MTPKEQDVLAAFTSAAATGKPERTVAVVAGDLGVLVDLCRRQQALLETKDKQLSEQAQQLLAIEPTDLES